MTEVQFTVPANLVSKERRRHGRDNVYSPDVTQDGEQVIAWLFRNKTRGWQPVTVPVGLSCEFYVPTKHQRDGDNMVKTVMDALNGVAYKDDSLVLHGTWRTRLDRKDPRTVVRLWVLDDGWD